MEIQRSHGSQLARSANTERLHFYCSCEDARTALILAEKGLGIAILPASMLEFSRNLKAYRIEDADLTTEILLAWRKGRIPVEVQAFLAMLEQ